MGGLVAGLPVNVCGGCQTEKSHHWMMASFKLK